MVDELRVVNKGKDLLVESVDEQKYGLQKMGGVRACRKNVMGFCCSCCGLPMLQ